MDGGRESSLPLGMSTAKDHKLGILMVALLAGASVRLDEIYYRKPVLEELWPDWLIAVILAFAATVVLIGTRRLLQSRDQIGTPDTYHAAEQAIENEIEEGSQR